MPHPLTVKITVYMVMHILPLELSLPLVSLLFSIQQLIVPTTCRVPPKESILIYLYEHIFSLEYVCT
jgi:hypothetical protein